VDATLGDIAAIQDQDAVLLPQRLGDHTLMFSEERRVLLRPFADELLQRPYLTCRLWPCAQEAQRHRFDVLARHVGREQPAQTQRA
jgi:hypothetical protein